jgi:hypothetical protein
MHVPVIGDVVAIVFERRRVEGQEPDGSYTQILEIIKLVAQAPEVTYAIAITVPESADVYLIDDSILVPQALGYSGCREGF